MSYVHTPADCEPGLADFAATVVAKLHENFPGDDLAIQQVLCLAEEVGEFTGAYRRWAGMARRTGPWEDAKAELADVVIAAYVTAQVLGIDLDTAWQEKAGTIVKRGWRESEQTNA